MNKKETLLQVYDVKLLLDGVEVQPSEIKEDMVLTVKMLLPKDLAKKYRVLHIHSATDIVELKQGAEAGIGTYIIDEDGYLVTQIDKLSEFAFANFKDNCFTHWILIALLVIGAVLFVLFYFFMKKDLFALITCGVGLVASIVLLILGSCTVCTVFGIIDIVTFVGGLGYMAYKK